MFDLYRYFTIFVGESMRYNLIHTAQKSIPIWYKKVDLNFCLHFGMNEISRNATLVKIRHVIILFFHYHRVIY